MTGRTRGVGGVEKVVESTVDPSSLEVGRVGLMGSPSWE